MPTASSALGSRNGAKNQVQLGEDGTCPARAVVPPCHSSPKKALESGECPATARAGSNPLLKAGRSVKS